MAKATHVEAFRVVPHDSDALWRTGDKHPEKFNGYVVLAKTATLPNEFPRRLADAVVSDETYERGRLYTGTLKLCGGFHPGIGFRFSAPNSKQVDVLVCLRCDDVGIVRGQKDRGKGLNYWPLNDLDKMNPLDVSVRDSSRGRSKLLALALEAFPDDEGLRELLKKDQKGKK